MRFAHGSTRIVILIGPFAIKFARLRPFWSLKRLFDHLLTGQVITKLKDYDQQPLMGGVRYISGGAWANLLEHNIYRLTKNQLLAPTYCTLFGLINIQRRGAPISPEELERENPFLRTAERAVTAVRKDLTRAVNFSRHAGVVKLHDYAQHELTQHLLSKQQMSERNFRLI